MAYNMTKSGMMPIILSYAHPMMRPSASEARQATLFLLVIGLRTSRELTKDQIAAEPKDHLERSHSELSSFGIAMNAGNYPLRTVFLRPNRLHSNAPTKTPLGKSAKNSECPQANLFCSPGNAIAPRRSCHSAVCLMSPFFMTLEMIVPEKTPLGNVTCANSER